MTVSTTAARAEYTGNGSTTAFAVVDTGGASAVIPVLDASHLQVYVDGTLKTEDEHYTVSIVPATKAATVTFMRLILRTEKSFGGIKLKKTPFRDRRFTRALSISEPRTDICMLWIQIPGKRFGN